MLIAGYIFRHFFHKERVVLEVVGVLIHFFHGEGFLRLVVVGDFEEVHSC
jgi:hypothetical protein